MLTAAQSNASPAVLSTADAKLAYYKTIGKAPGVFFCGGFMSDMTGTKALALEETCQALGHSYIRFDYQGHGQSSGKMIEGSISTWFQDALTVFDALTKGPQILVGSSMGGWIATLLALARPDRIKGLIGIAAGLDFTEELIWDKLTPADKEKLAQDGVLYYPSLYSDQPYAITQKLLEDGRKNLLLSQEIPLDIPIRLLHGLQDPDVPWQQSLRFTEKLQAQDVRLLLIKDGDHRLARPQDLQLLTRELRELLMMS